MAIFQRTDNHDIVSTHPYDVAEAIDKLHRWTATGIGRARLQRVLKQFVVYELVDTDDATVTRLLADVDASRLYWVTPTMLSLLSTASEEMPYQTLRPNDLPIDTGFVMFADELVIGNTRQPIRAISWSTSGALDEAGSARFTIWWSRPTAALNTDTTESELRAAGIPPLIPTRWFDWDFEKDWRLTYGSSREAPTPVGVEDLRSWVAFARRWLQALFAIMGEKYVTQNPPTTNKTERRRAERAGWDVATLRVIDLRRARPTGTTNTDDTGGVEWTQQWWVSGHWRNQWYPSTEEHRLRYIGPHTKGPQDKPLGPPPKRIFKIDTPHP